MPRTGPELSEEAGDRAPAMDLVEQVRRINRENERLFSRLVEGERRFRGLARAVWQVQEQERRRIARELHDGLGQTLTALKIRLERLAAHATDHPEIATEAASTVELAADALQEARRLAHLLRPQVLDDLGLEPALRWLARTVGEWTGFAVRLELDGLDGERLDPETETVVFRVVQEAVTNAMKHSGAPGAEVRVTAGPRRLLLEVTDRGDGFDPSASPAGLGATGADKEVRSEGFGLPGLRDRVELAGGRFAVSSQPGDGTRVTAELPIEGLAREGEA